MGKMRVRERNCKSSSIFLMTRLALNKTEILMNQNVLFNFSQSLVPEHQRNTHRKHSSNFLSGSATEAKFEDENRLTLYDIKTD